MRWGSEKITEFSEEQRRITVKPIFWRLKSFNVGCFSEFLHLFTSLRVFLQVGVVFF